ncbi:MAG: CHAT domain-containing protein [Acidobacteriia bacterium]|nr:CHAT domain-containing protein [Terriglobia bacterium]
MPDERYCFDWYPGASGQLEILGPSETKRSQFRYTPPFRATLRPPFADAQLQTLQDLDPIYIQLDKVAAWLKAGGSRKGGPAAPPPPPPPGKVDTELKKLGQLLLTLVLPPRIRSELQIRDLYLEIGTDEALLDLPWELIYDGNDFLCASNFVGRFVNLSESRIAAQQRVAPVYGVELEKLRILVISVPEPHPKDRSGNVLKDKDGNAVEYRKLTGAIAETEAVSETLAHIPFVQLEVVEDATLMAVFDKLQDGVYDIVHYSGHAVSNPDDIKSSGIVLQDRLLTTAQLSGMLGAHPPVFCFLNGCQTTRIAGSGWKGQYNLYGLGSAILDTGSYLLGSTWEIEDDTAASFASRFYQCFLEGNSLGFATREARRQVRNPDYPDDLGWASYTFYGDPRLFIRAAVSKTILTPSRP